MTVPPLPAFEWTEADVRGLLQRYGRNPLQLRAEQLRSWWRNLVLHVWVDDEEFVIRRYGLTPEAEIAWELEVIAMLRARDFPTIAPLARADGSGHVAEFLGGPAILYPFVRGARAEGDAMWETAVAQTTQAVAELHAITRGVSFHFPRGSASAEPQRTLERLRAQVASSDDTSIAGFVDEAQAVIERTLGQAHSAGDAMPSGVVHHDAHIGNVLFDNGRLVALIDFDDAYEGFLVADIASMVANWGRTEACLDAARGMRVVEAYERHRRLTTAERSLLPDFVLLHTLGDAIEDVRGHLERGGPAADALETSPAYARYVIYRDGAALEAFRNSLLAR